MNLIVISLIVLGCTGLIAAVLLYAVAQKFKVEEDPRIDLVQEVLPGANCGGCGFAGCRAMAEACVKATSLDGLLCPVGGAATMDQVGEILGMKAAASEPKVAVVRSNGTCEARPKTSTYDGTRTCAIMNSLYVGETGCVFGCLGCGDCVAACQFDAIHINKETGLAEVDESKCTSCGACVKTCPRKLIELVPAAASVRVQCSNKDKGKAVMDVCQAGCIGCTLCTKQCQFDAIHMDGNIAKIDYSKCTGCGACAEKCPKKVIRRFELS